MTGPIRNSPSLISAITSKLGLSEPAPSPSVGGPSAPTGTSPAASSLAPPPMTGGQDGFSAKSSTHGAGLAQMAGLAQTVLGGFHQAIAMAQNPAGTAALKMGELKASLPAPAKMALKMAEDPTAAMNQALGAAQGAADLKMGALKASLPGPAQAALKMAQDPTAAFHQGLGALIGGANLKLGELAGSKAQPAGYGQGSSLSGMAAQLAGTSNPASVAKGAGQGPSAMGTAHGASGAADLLKGVGGPLGKAAGRFVPGLNIAMASTDVASAAKTIADPKASVGQKLTSGITAAGSLAAATNIPVVSQIGAAVSTAASVLGPLAEKFLGGAR
jgi:hypothetical protein